MEDFRRNIGSIHGIISVNHKASGSKYFLSLERGQGRNASDVTMIVRLCQICASAKLAKPVMYWEKAFLYADLEFLKGSISDQTSWEQFFDTVRRSVELDNFTVSIDKTDNEATVCLFDGKSAMIDFALPAPARSSGQSHSASQPSYPASQSLSMEQPTSTMSPEDSAAATVAQLVARVRDAEIRAAEAEARLANVQFEMVHDHGAGPLFVGERGKAKPAKNKKRPLGASLVNPGQRKAAPKRTKIGDDDEEDE